MASRPHHFSQRRAVEFHETDAAGLVHFTNLLRWMEAAEHAFLREQGVPVLDAAKKSGWPRAEVAAQFLAPLHFGDEVETRLWVRVRNSTRLNFYFEIWKLTGTRGPLRCVHGHFTTVHVSLTKSKLRPSPISTAAYKKLKKLSNRAGDLA